MNATPRLSPAPAPQAPEPSAARVAGTGAVSQADSALVVVMGLAKHGQGFCEKGNRSETQTRVQSSKKGGMLVQ